MILLYVYVFIVGSCVASFINVVIFRLPLHISVVKGRSYCPHCFHKLCVLDLIPILSYVCLCGRCRYCGNQIKSRDTLLEILGGLIFCLCFYRYGMDIMCMISFVFAMILQAVSFIDIDTMEIPDVLVFCCFILGIMSMPFMSIDLFNRVIGMFVFTVPMILVNCFIKDAFGGGDIKLLCTCGFFMGWKYLTVGMFIAVFIATIYATYLLIYHKINYKSYITFGPFISVGLLTSLLYADVIINKYLELFI